MKRRGLSAARRRLRFDALIAPEASRAKRVALVVVAAVTVGLIALIDADTPPTFSLSAFYLLPAVLVTVAVSAPAGLAIAAECAVAWVLADSVNPDGPALLTSLWNGATRFIILALVVLLLEALRTAYAEARASDLRTREFLGFAAHQLRTPVSGLRSSAEALIMGGGTPAQEGLLANVASESERVGRLVSALLQIARLDQGERLPRRPVDVSALVAAEVERAERRAPGLSFRFRCGPGGDRVVDVAADSLRESTSNLLDNAVRHARTMVEVNVSGDEHETSIVVHDDGDGVPLGAEEMVFERFVSLDGRGGSGLGLAIVRSLLEAQGGSARLEAGAFVLRIPSTLSTVQSARQDLPVSTQ